MPEDAQARAVSLTRIGDTALRSGEIETAVGLFEQAMLTDGRNVSAALGLGDALLAAGRDLDASKAFERALALQPDLPAAGYGYARAMIAIQRPEVAVEHLRRLVAGNPSSLEALNALGVAQDLLGEHAAATQTYRQALTVMPASASVRNNLALSLALQEQFADALDILRPLAEGPDATRRSRQNLALVYGLQGDLAAAERISRVDLGGQDLVNNLAYFAAVRGLEPPVVRAATLSPEQTFVGDEPRLTRKSRSARRPVAADAASATPTQSGSTPRRHRRLLLPKVPARWCRSSATPVARPLPRVPGSSMSAAFRPRPRRSIGASCAHDMPALWPGSGASPAPVGAPSRCWSDPSRTSRPHPTSAPNSAPTAAPAGPCGSERLRLGRLPALWPSAEGNSRPESGGGQQLCSNPIAPCSGHRQRVGVWVAPSAQSIDPALEAVETADPIPKLVGGVSGPTLGRMGANGGEVTG